MPTSYGGYSSSGRGTLLGVVTVIVAVNFVIYEWGDFKVSKMLPAYPDKPRTVKHSPVLHTTHLESQLVKAKQRVLDLTKQQVSEGRETEDEERERWEEQKAHLLEHIAQLEAELKKTQDELKNIKEAYSLPISEEDKGFIADLAAGGQS
tara:strand:- start:1179 stop:1628 length:450 start_codon:yes stop_codon:yes gene_type:complete